MAIRMARIVRAKHSSGQVSDIAKGYTAVYVGNKKRRYKIPVSYLDQALFQDLLSQAEEEFGFDPPTGGLTLPCTDDVFFNVISRLNQS